MDSIQIEQTAAAWLARRDGGNWSDADRAQLDAWLHESTAHRVAFIRLEMAWQQALRLKAFVAGTPASEQTDAAAKRRAEFFGRSQIRAPSLAYAVANVSADASDEPSVANVTQTNANQLDTTQANATSGNATPAQEKFAHMPARTAPPRYAAIAACLVVALGALAWVGVGMLPRESYSTAVGGLASVPMQDGSKVTLNTNSEIRVALSDTERRVNLEQGEAFFQVAKDPSRPFIVSAGDQRIIAVGTQFSVRREGGDVRVIVTEGLVRVERGGGPKLLPSAELAAGSVARTGGEGVLIQHKPVAEVEEYLSWRKGFLVFRETTLAQVVMEFNRYSTRKIVIDDDSLAGMRIGGSFRSDNVDSFLRLLRDGFDIEVESQGDQLVLKRP